MNFRCRFFGHRFGYRPWMRFVRAADGHGFYLIRQLCSICLHEERTFLHESAFKGNP